MPSLTRGQQAVYDFLCQHPFPQPPTLDELCQAMGLKSRGSMHKHIQALIDAGLVEPMGHKQRGIRLVEAANDEAGLPMFGYIAAGRPIEALPDSERIEVPGFLRGTGENYVLQIKGDSMIEEGIMDGDWVVIEKRDQARNGEIVVALIDNQEATLKRLEQKPGEVVLHPANASMSPQHYRPEQVTIQGVLVGQMRAY